MPGGLRGYIGAPQSRILSDACGHWPVTLSAFHLEFCMFRTRFLPLALGALVVLAGCDGTPPPPGAEVLETMASGTPRPDVLVALPVGPGVGDSTRLVAGYLRDRYMIEGEGVEVLWVRRTTSEPLEELGRRDVNPVLFRNDHLDGWGWDHFDRRAEAWGLRDRLLVDEDDAPDWAPGSGVEIDAEEERQARPPLPPGG